MAKEFLRSKNVPYQERDVSRDQAAAHEMMAKSGQMGVPVILAEDPSRPDARDVIVGFDRPRLEQLASRVAAGAGATSGSGAPGDSPTGHTHQAGHAHQAGHTHQTGHEHEAGHSHASDDGPRLGLRVKEDPAGLLVDAVHPGTLADRAGLQPGDIVTAVDGRPVRTTDDLADAAGRLTTGELVALTFRRDGQLMGAHLHP